MGTSLDSTRTMWLGNRTWSGHGWSSLKTGHGQGLLAMRGLPPPGHPRNIEPGMNSPFRCGAEPIPGPILPAAAITYKHTQLYLSKAGVWPGVIDVYHCLNAYANTKTNAKTITNTNTHSGPHPASQSHNLQA